MVTKRTKNTPEIVFEETQLLIAGESYPENVFTFYEPIFQWIQGKIHDESDIYLIFKLTYFNTNSSKVITDILLLLNDYYIAKNKNIKVKWYHAGNDIDAKESAEDFFYDIKFPFEIIET